MRKYKKNITIKIACVSTEFLICIIPMYLIMTIFLTPHRINEILEAMGTMLLIIIAVNLFLYGISLIGKIFIKTTYIIDDENLIIKEENNERVISLQSVKSIIYDLGLLSRYGETSTKLVLFDANYKMIISIINPPLTMVAKNKKKCKTAKVSYDNSKRFVTFLLMSCGISLVICIINLFVQ